MAPVLRIAGRVLGWLVLLAVALAVVAVVVVPRAGGAQALTVLTGSMTPSLPVGSVAVSRPVDPWTVEPGDVISFQVAPGDPTLVTHRVVEVVTDDGELEFRTKGDANDGDDPDLVPAGAVVGELWYHVPWVGHLTVRAGDPAVLLAVAVLGLLAYAGYHLIAAFRPARRGLSRHLVLASATGPTARAVLDVARANGGRLVTPATDPRRLPDEITVECVVDPDAVTVLERALRDAGATSVATASVQLPAPGRRPAPSSADHQVGTTA
ncbi:signal peptidase I [Aquipuribacter sp. MA13-6]|uniref:signal peptidase I n=1 Tax=unclassified Aquipuribacter TaxID=2635084 RepID=UPI003EED5933